MVVPSRELSSGAAWPHGRAEAERGERGAWISSATASVSQAPRLAAVLLTFPPFPGPACKNADSEIMHASSKINY